MIHANCYCEEQSDGAIYVMVRYWIELASSLCASQ
jgi:hypothetical protein